MNARDIHEDWAGPWPLDSRVLNLYDQETAVQGTLFLDYHGELFEPGSFFVAVRRLLPAEAVESSFDFDDLIAKLAGGEHSNDWTNGEILTSARELVLLLEAADADWFSHAMRTLALNAHNLELPTSRSGITDTVNLDVEQLGEGDDLTVSVELSAHPYGGVGAGFYFGGEPISAPGDAITMSMSVWFSDYTNAHPWTFSLTDAVHVSGIVEGLLAARISYLDMIENQQMRVEAVYPDGAVGMTDAAPDFADLRGAADRLAEQAVMEGAASVTVVMGGVALSTVTFDDLTEEQQDQWLLKFNSGEGE